MLTPRPPAPSTGSAALYLSAGSLQNPTPSSWDACPWEPPLLGGRRTGQVSPKTWAALGGVGGRGHPVHPCRADRGWPGGRLSLLQEVTLQLPRLPAKKQEAMEGSKEWGIRLILSPRKSGRQEGGREKAGGRQEGGREGGREESLAVKEPLVGHPDLASCNLGLLPELVLFFLFSFFKRVVPPFPLLAVDKPGYGSGLQVLPPVTGWDSSVPGPAGSGSGCADGQRASGSGQ